MNIHDKIKAEYPVIFHAESHAKSKASTFEDLVGMILISTAIGVLAYCLNVG